MIDRLEAVFIVLFRRKIIVIAENYQFSTAADCTAVQVDGYIRVEGKL